LFLKKGEKGMKDPETKFLGNDESGETHSLGYAEGKMAIICLVIFLVCATGLALFVGPPVSKAVLEIARIIL
jgi:hypothetical protein